MPAPSVKGQDGIGILCDGGRNGFHYQAGAGVPGASYSPPPPALTPKHLPAGGSGLLPQGPSPRLLMAPAGLPMALALCV